MSNQELDSLFKSKLDRLEKMPSSSAWNKIQSQTQSKKAWPWIRIAAAITLLMISGLTYWVSLKQPINRPEVAKTMLPKQITPATEQPEVLAESAQTQSNEKGKVTQSLEPIEQVTSVIEVAKIKASEKQASVKTKDAAQPKTVESMTQGVNLAVNDLPDATIRSSPASDNQPEETKGTTLEFNLEDFAKAKVAARNKNSNSSISETNKDSQKGIDKVLNIVKETGIGDLREAKNEILAFNFKKDNDDSK